MNKTVVCGFKKQAVGGLKGKSPSEKRSKTLTKLSPLRNYLLFTGTPNLRAGAFSFLWRRG